MSIILCAACKGPLFEVVPLDGLGNWAVEEDAVFDVQVDELGEYIACPACGGKNNVVSSQSPTGLPGCTLRGVR